jgi:predicted O-methyltransferase YrrM
VAIPANAIHPSVSPEIARYLTELAGDDVDPLVFRMEAHARITGFPTVGRATGRWLTQLCRLIGAKRVFEFGSGYGYSAWFFADAVGHDGQVVGSDDDPALIALHREMWAHHAFAPRVDLRLGRGRNVLSTALGTFDAVLIDSTKGEYGADLDAALDRVRAGGLVLVDNVLWGGRVVAPEPDATTQAIQAFNRAIFTDPRVDACILPVGDGLAVLRKR